MLQKYWITSPSITGQVDIFNNMIVATCPAWRNHIGKDFIDFIYDIHADNWECIYNGGF